MKTFQALAVLLEYPCEDLVSAVAEIDQVLRSEQLLDEANVRALQPLLEHIAHSDLLEQQEAYVDTFDRGRATSLNLFEHVHGESRERGQAMIDLRQQYRARGLELTAQQLPDYLPVMLEYLALGSPDQARAMLGDCAHILRSIGAALVRRGSPYAAVLHALQHLAGVAAEIETALPTGAQDDSRAETLDRAWAEEPITFLGGGCAAAQATGHAMHSDYKAISS